MKDDMSAPNSLSSLSGHHPVVWPAVPCTNVQQQLASPSRKLPSPTFLRRRINKNRHLHSTLPNWTRLSRGDQDAASNHAHQDQLSKQPDNQPQRLAATYSTPQTASAAYNCGLLKSDDNISSNALRIRLAFRYHLTSQFQHQDDKLSAAGDDNVDDIDDDLLYLCWVRQDGIPCHFRKLMPFEKNHNNSNNNRGKTKIRGGSTAILQADKVEPSESIDSNGNSDALFVNEHDTIERTFPGHAFVFCRRIANYNHRQYITDDDDDGNIDINTRPRVVHDENGHTIFLRRKKQQQSLMEKEDEEEVESHKGGKGNMSEDKHSGNNGDDGWEAYFVVGGFRPGPMPHKSSSPAVEDEASESESNKSVDSDEVESTSNDGDSTDDDSDSDDEMELRVQLVTIRRAKMPIPADIQQDHAITTSLRGAAQSEISSVAVDASKTPSQLDQILDDLKVTVRLAQIDPTPVDVSSKHYDHVTLGGWPCRIEPGCFHHSSEKECRENGKCSLQSRFEIDIAAACQSLPPMAREKLQQTTPIWINKSHMWGPRVAPIRGRDACFHPGAQWLSRNGDNPLKCGGVEFYDAKHYLSDCDHWGPGGLILHELSHAWHNIHIANGYDNEQIEECYEMAMKDGLYDCVRVHGSQGPKCKAYACTDPMEYFAELSVAFLGGLDDTLEHNKWFPFNRTQLREHDPRAFDMLCRMWGVDEDDDVETNVNSGREIEEK